MIHPHGGSDLQLGSRLQLAALGPAGTCDLPIPRQGQLWVGPEARAHPHALHSDPGWLQGALLLLPDSVPGSQAPGRMHAPLRLAVQQQQEQGAGAEAAAAPGFPSPPTTAQQGMGHGRHSMPPPSRTLGSEFMNHPLQRVLQGWWQRQHPERHILWGYGAQCPGGCQLCVTGGFLHVPNLAFSLS